jgi:hypothetical protein
MSRRSAEKKPKRARKTLKETEAELFAELYESQQPRGDATYAPPTFEDQDELPDQTHPMYVVRRWFA